MSQQFYTFLFYSLIFTAGFALIVFLIKYYVFRPKQKIKYPKLYSLSTDEGAKILYIKYELPEKTSLTISIQDFHGNTIEKLIEDEKKEGLYSLDYNISYLPKGEYFINITTHNLNSSKKLVIK